MSRAPQKRERCPSRHTKESGALKGRRTPACAGEGTEKIVEATPTPHRPTRLGLLGRWLQIHGFPRSEALACERRVRLVAESLLPAARERHLLVSCALSVCESVGRSRVAA